MVLWLFEHGKMMMIGLLLLIKVRVLKMKKSREDDESVENLDD